MNEEGLQRRASGLQPLVKVDLPRLGEYEILAELARGGMGRVYLARRRGQAGFERLFAIKVLHDHMMDEPEALMMLLDEANIACRLHHPNVVPIVDIGEHDEGYFLVMEYVEGCTFQALLRRSKKHRPARLIVPILIDALRGLHAAHELTDPEGDPSNLVHRDFSPHNLMIGVGGTCRVTDFGIAKVTARFTNTRAGFNKGKLAYMSPEQLSAAVDIDRRADVWAAGVVLWFALTGEHPFRSDSEAATTNKILRYEVPPPSTVGFNPPDCFDIVCEKALKRDRDQRYRSAIDMADDLHRIAVKNEMLGSPSEVAAWVKDAFEADFEARNAAIRSLRSDAERTQLPILPGLSSLSGGTHSASFPGMKSSTPSTGPSALRRYDENQEVLEELRDSAIPVILDPKAGPPPTPAPRETLGPPVLKPNPRRGVPLWMLAAVPILVILALVIGLFLGSSSSTDDEGATTDEPVHQVSTLAPSPGRKQPSLADDSGSAATPVTSDAEVEPAADPFHTGSDSSNQLVSITLSGLPESARVRVDGNSVEGHEFQIPADGYEHIIRADAVGYFQWTHRMVAPAHRSQELVVNAEMIPRPAREPEQQPTKRPTKRPSKLVRDPGF